MRRALETHPDRNGNTPQSTRDFQQLADAYHTLSDSQRRKEYDRARKERRGQEYSGEGAANADNVFGDVFGDFLRAEGVGEGGQVTTTYWAPLGMIGGAILGFIIFNLPGCIMGGFAGRKLGAIRDQKGKAVYEVFQELPHAQKLQILSVLAARFLAGPATSSSF
ncbi:hypothetical protein H4219_004949 [Mycoemilia scoparia]|uniref:J domain-containing protein n=1 Tax=Mycoemilia scoparia TaxID=417184 RepID=A0A9W8DM04_9FUNG|nr:hypothetical protein H4219_004949 [Mycoemilia scoparia]